MDESRRLEQKFGITDFTDFMFETVQKNEIFCNNAHFSRLVIYQSRFANKTCSSRNSNIETYITSNNLASCTDPKKYSYENYGTNDIFTINTLIPNTTKEYKIGGRTYPIGKGFYADLDWGTGITGETLKTNYKANYSDLGWTDNKTNFIAFIFNLYNPSFNTVMYWIVIYDNRYGWSSLSDIRSSAGIYRQEQYSGNYKIIGIFLLICFCGLIIYSFNQFIFWQKKIRVDGDDNDYKRICNKNELEHWFELRKESLSEYDKTPKEKLLKTFFLKSKTIKGFLIVEKPDLFVI